MNKIVFWKIKIFFIAFFLSISFIFIFNNIFFINSNLIDIKAGVLIFGLIFGPIGAFANALSVFFLGLYYGLNIFISLLNSIIIFISSLIPYVLWYTIFRNEEHELINFSSVYNVLKFILISLISSLIMTIVNFGVNNFLWDILYFLLTIVSFSFFMGSIIILNYLDIGFYIPIKDSKFFDNISFFNYLNKHPKIYDLFLIITTCFYLFYLFVPNKLSLICILVLLSLFLLKPIKKIDFKKYSLNKYTVNLSKKDISFVENLIIMMIILQVIFFISVFFLFKYRIFIYTFSFNPELSLTILCFIALLIVSIPFLLITLFLEKNIFNPIEKISFSIKNYITKGKLSQNNIQIIKDYEKKFANKNIIGDLSYSLIKMNSDLEKHIEEITNLNMEQERIKTELDIAKKIQESSIPHNFEIFKQFDINVEGISLPAKSVGGDFFDFFMIDKENVAFIIGDASGKGIPASLFMFISRYMIKQQIFNEYKDINSDNKLSRVFYNINNILYEGNSEKMFLTSWAGVLNINSGKLDFVNAGHEPPIIKNDGKVKFLDVNPNLVLGILKNYEYDSSSIILDKGDRVILYTDGVTDANNNLGEFFGNKRLLNSVNNDNLSVSQEIKNIMETIGKFIQIQEQFDDLTILIFEFNKNK